MSLDGYIAGPNGEFVWIPQDPDIDFAALLAQFDTLLVGRRTFEDAGADVDRHTGIVRFPRTLGEHIRFRMFRFGPAGRKERRT